MRYLRNSRLFAIVLISAFISCLLLSGVSFWGTTAVAQETNTTERPIAIENERVGVYLQSQRLTVDHDESITFEHSVTNYVTNNENVTVQLILEAPSGSDVSGTGGVAEGSGSQFTTVTTVEPGRQDSMRIHVDLHEPGKYEMSGQAVYFFGSDQDTGGGTELTVPVEKRPPPPSTTEQISQKGSNILRVFPTMYTAFESVLSTRLQTQSTSVQLPVYLISAVLIPLVIFSFISPLISNIITSKRGERAVEKFTSAVILIWVVGFFLYLLDMASSGAGSEPTLLAQYVAILLTVAAAVVPVGAVIWIFYIIINGFVQGISPNR